MRKTTLLIALLLASSAAWADSYNFGNRVVTDGDSIGKLVEAAGKPDLVTPIQNEYGAQTGEKWTYFRDGKTIVFTINTSGKILSITESRST